MEYGPKVVEPGYIGAMGFSLGARVPIDGAADDGRRQFIDFLKDDGFRSFRRSGASSADLAVAAIRDCLEKSRIAPGDIDTVIFATESLSGAAGPDPIGIRNTFLAGLAACGITPDAIHACWLNECANLAYALKLGHALISSENARNVLALAADRHDDRTPRLMASGASVMSDGAAAVLIGARGPYRIRQIVTRFAPDVFAAERDNDVQRKTQGLMSALSGFAERIGRETGRMPADYPLVLTDNLHTMYLDFIREGLSIPAGHLVQPSKADAAHVFSIDGLLGLDALAASGRAPDGTVAILTVIPWSLGFIVLEAT